LVIEIDSPGKPHACPSPIAHQGKKGSSEIKVKNRIQRPLKIVNINFQSIKNKKTELDILLDTTKPDVIIGTETWLDLSHSRALLLQLTFLPQEPQGHLGDLGPGLSSTCPLNNSLIRR
jgi:hypothetical protein